jgi:hypothetical protein
MNYGRAFIIVEIAVFILSIIGTGLAMENLGTPTVHSVKLNEEQVKAILLYCDVAGMDPWSLCNALREEIAIWTAVLWLSVAGVITGLIGLSLIAISFISRQEKGGQIP